MQDELAGLYDKSSGYTPTCAAKDDNAKIYLTDLITVSCWLVWASETRGSGADGFSFHHGTWDWLVLSYASYLFRALPVRSAK